MFALDAPVGMLGVGTERDAHIRLFIQFHKTYTYTSYAPLSRSRPEELSLSRSRDKSVIAGKTDEKNNSIGASKAVTGKSRQEMRKQISFLPSHRIHFQTTVAV